MFFSPAVRRTDRLDKVMIRVRVAGAVFLLVVFGFALGVSGQVVVYENAEQYSGYRFESTNEYGDELNLAGSARVITKIQFQYYGDFQANLDEKMKVRIYANTGPYYLGNKDYQLPGSAPLWESPYIFLNSGPHTQEVPVPSIKVPEHFTWTVQFSGISQRTGITTIDPLITNDVVGLMFYGTATIGSSFNDFWERLTTGWTPVTVSGPPKNNFAAQVTAIQESVIPRLSISRYNATKYVVAKWPAALTNYVLQYRTLSSGWFNISAPPAKIGDNWERVLDPNSSGALYRLKDISTARGAVPLTIVEDETVIHVRWPKTESGLVLQSETAPGSGLWEDRPTPAVPTGDYFGATLRKKDPIEAFRLRESYVAARLEVIPQNGNLLIRWPLAARGQTLQSKTGTGSWLNVTNAIVTETSSCFEAVVPIETQDKVFRLKQ